MPRRVDQVNKGLESAAWLDRPAKVLQAAVGASFGRRVVTDVLSGTWLGHPLHPLLVTLPTGLWTSAVVADLSGRDAKLARRLMGIGVLTALPAAAAGLMDWSYTEGAERRVGVVHATANTAALGLFASSWAARGRGSRGLATAVLGVACLSAGGYLGAHLSYAMGVGVDTTAFSTGPDEWTDVAADDDVHGLSATRLDAGSVLLSRHEGQPVALDNRCTHRGGPLAEGKLVSGCVECPWHASRFALPDGSVRRGPATRPQPTYESRVRAGRVEIRRKEQRSLRTNPVH